MKTTFKLIGAVAAVAALLASCKKSENPVKPEDKTIEMTIVASSQETKTVLGVDGSVTWADTGEKLQVLETAGTTISSKQSSEGTTTDGGDTMTFPVSFTASTETSFSYNAVYPYSALVEKPTDLAKAKINLTSTQYPTASSFGPAADILISKTVDGLKEQPTELELQFARVIAVGKMTIKNLNSEENVKKVTFSATDKPVTGRSYIDLTNATAPDGYGYYPTDNVVLDYDGKEILADGMTAYFTCWPFSIAAGETFSVVVETENYIFTKDVPLAEGKSLAFNVGRATAFSVSFTDIEGVEKTPATQLVPDGEYVITYDKNMMMVGTTSNKYRDVAALPEAANEDGSYSVDATAAWNFVYDSETDTYLINSVEDNSLYLQGSSTASDFKLVAKGSATSFTITKDEEAGTYRIANTRFIGYNYNNGSPRFAMYAGTSADQPVDLNLYTAKVAKLAEITVQGTLDLTAELAESSFSVSWKNVDLSSASVDVYQDEACTIKEESWISVEFNEDKSAIIYTVLDNETDAERKAYIKVEAKSIDGESKVSKVIVVSQAGANSGTTVTVTKNISAISGTTTNGTQVSSMKLDDNITLTASSGTNSGKVYSEGAEWRFYQADNGTLTISAKEGCTLVSASITFTVSNSGILVYNSSTVSSASSVSLSGSSAVFSVSDTAADTNKGQVKITSITVTYVGGSSEGGSDPEQLAAPKVSCSTKTANSLTFTWAAVANATEYQVSTDGGFNYGDTQKGTTYTWSGLQANTEYTLYVKAVSDNASYTESDAAFAKGTTAGGSTGEDAPADYTFVTAQSTSNTAYASNYDVTISKIQWSVPGNQNFNGYVRIGGQKLTNTVRYIYSKTALPAGYKTITMSTNGISNASLSVNSVVCKVYSTATGAASGGETDLIATMTNKDTDWAASTSKTIKFTDNSTETGTVRYYRFEFNLTNSKSSNYGIDLRKIVFSAN